MHEATYLLQSTKKHDIDVIAEPRDEWQLHAES